MQVTEDRDQNIVFTWNGNAAMYLHTNYKSIRVTSGNEQIKKTYAAAITMPMKAAPYL